MKADPKLYMLNDGTYADPKDCKKADDGVLRHKNGVSVALNGDGSPFTLGDTAAINADAAAGAEIATTASTSVDQAKPADDKAA